MNGDVTSEHSGGILRQWWTKRQIAKAERLAIIKARNAAEAARQKAIDDERRANDAAREKARQLVAANAARRQSGLEYWKQHLRTHVQCEISYDYNDVIQFSAMFRAIDALATTLQDDVEKHMRQGWTQEQARANFIGRHAEMRKSLQIVFGQAMRFPS